MESIQGQVNVLDQKIDTLYQAIDQLSHRIAELLTDRQLKESEVNLVGGRAGYGSQVHHYRDALLDHKDVLVDGEGMESHLHLSERAMSPELQIQRLTAQLTAAYNRIATLEEQILSRRVLSS
jgi:chaperonin cofactor prefoldin